MPYAEDLTKLTDFFDCISYKCRNVQELQVFFFTEKYCMPTEACRIFLKLDMCFRTVNISVCVEQ